MPASNLNRTWLRFASRIERALSAPMTTTTTTTCAPPVEQWQQLQRQCAHLHWVSKRGWPTATSSVQLAISRTIEALQASLLDCQRTIATMPNRSRVSRQREIFADLQALCDEFPSVTLDLHRGELTVETHSIVLEEIDLGPFAIVLTLAPSKPTLTYAVFARQPHPANGDDTTTHPHVRDDRLCEGQGRSSIHAALAQGRLFDFFVLVRQILETYNPVSAFVRLNDWQGVSCTECGQFDRAEELTYCHECETDLCYDCAIACEECGRDGCSRCQRSCHDCQRDLCEACIGTCPACAERICSECLEDHSSNCSEKNDAQTPPAAQAASDLVATPHAPV